MKRNDFIILPRGIIDLDMYGDNETFRVFLHLMIMATGKPVRYGYTMLKRGQFFTTSRELSAVLHISTKYITEAIKKLRDSGEITTERCGNGTIFTVVNYDNYQGKETKPQKKESERIGNGIGCTDF